MNFEVVILGLIQGFTEFLPVSSSGHLALAQIFMGTQNPPLSYDLLLHVATTAATIIFFFKPLEVQELKDLRGMSLEQVLKFKVYINA